MSFIRANLLLILLYMVSILLPVSNILVISGCAGHTKIRPPMEVVRAGNESASGQIKLTWDEVPGAVSYYLYVSETPGAKESGERFVNVANPVTITNLKVGRTYYFVVTSVSYGTESEPSEEISYSVP